MRRYRIFVLLSICLWTVYGREIFVQNGASGNGTSSSPYGSIQQALNVASSGDIITLYNGTYTGSANTILSLPAVSSITIRGYDDNPASTIIRWTDISVRPWINMSSGSPMVSVRGIGFYDRQIDTMPETLGTTYIVPALFYMTSGVLSVDRCRFERHVTVSIDGTEVVYIDIRKNSTAYVTNSIFLHGYGAKGISVDTGSVLVDSCIFVNHTRGSSGSCVGTRITQDQGPQNATIINSTFVTASTPIRYSRGGGRIVGNSFYNCTNVLMCTTIILDILGSGNKFCGANTNFCSRFSSQNVRTPDGCGVCDGNNQFKDCNGECFGSAYGSACIPKKSIYVSPTGSGDGSSAASPLSNISQAIDQANYGDSIKLLPGNYAVGNISTRGKQGIIIRSNSGNPYDVTLTCSSAPTAFTFADGESFDTEIQGITVTQCGSTDASPVSIGTDTGITFRNMRFVNNGNLLTVGIINLNDSFVRVFDSTFASNTAFRGSVVFGVGNPNKTSSFYAKNSRFLNNYDDEGGAIHFQNGLVDVSESYFSGNDAYYASAEMDARDCFVSWVNNTISLSGASAGAPKSILCTTRNDSVQYGNIYCGTPPRWNYIFCSPLFNTTNQTAIVAGGVPDACGVCNGNNACLPPSPSPSPSTVPSSSPSSSPIPSSTSTPSPSAVPSSSPSPSATPSVTPTPL